MDLDNFVGLDHLQTRGRMSKGLVWHNEKLDSMGFWLILKLLLYKPNSRAQNFFKLS